MIEQGLVTPPSGGRVVWGGRLAPQHPGSLDGWSCDRTALLAILDEASELVIVDALSFPWEQMRSAHRDIPLNVALPAELDGPDIAVVFGECLLRYVTRYDRLVEPRAEVRELLERGWPATRRSWVDSLDAELHADVDSILEASADNLVDVETPGHVVPGGSG